MAFGTISVQCLGVVTSSSHMPTIVKTPSGTWKALVRKTGFPTTIKTFRLKRDAEDWARRLEDDMVRGMFVQRAPAERMTFEKAIERYIAEVTPTKRPATQSREIKRIRPLVKFFGRYSLAGITPDLVAQYRDMRLAGDDRKKAEGEAVPRAANTVRLELALLGHLYTVAVKEWGLGLAYNPVTNVRRPAPGPGRNRRLEEGEEARLLKAIDAHSNPMLRWIVRVAIETGMRSSEITTLRRQQVDLKRRVVRLVETKNTLPRTVPLTVAADAVDGWRHVRCPHASAWHRFRPGWRRADRNARGCGLGRRQDPRCAGGRSSAERSSCLSLCAPRRSGSGRRCRDGRKSNRGACKVGCSARATWQLSKTRRLSEREPQPSNREPHPSRSWVDLRASCLWFRRSAGRQCSKFDG